MESGALATPLILPDLQLPGRVNQHWQYNAMDSPDHCADGAWFQSYPYRVQYDFNSRGFRDQEWPDGDRDLAHSIWCLGDSFTVGIGSPDQHIWPRCLQDAVQRRCINVSMDGASNDWISRRATQIMTTVQPTNMIVMWSYIHRRELELGHDQIQHVLESLWQDFWCAVRDPAWPRVIRIHDFSRLDLQIRQELAQAHDVYPFRILPDLSGIDCSGVCLDEHRRKQFDPDTTDQQDLENFRRCVLATLAAAQHTNLIHCFVPEFCPPHMTESCLAVFDSVHCAIAPFQALDRARDGHHFDIATSQWLVNQLVARLA
jgi:hypothetical protein